MATPFRLVAAILLVVCVPVHPTDLIDVVLTKDGSVYKGVVVENKVNEYVRIELAGGSVIKLTYENIESIERVATPPMTEPAPEGRAVPRLQFHPQPSLFSPKYATLDGGVYPISLWGFGYSSLIRAVELTTPQDDPELRQIIGRYKSKTTVSGALYVGGFAVEIGGIVLGLIEDARGTTRSVLSWSLVFGGAAVALTGALMGSVDPTDLAAHLNQHYPRP